jgi:hypothetical protein
MALQPPWSTRWSSLSNIIGVISQRYPTLGNPQLTALGQVAGMLGTFADELLDFFNANFASGNFEHSANFPEEHVYWTIVDQAQSDLEVIQRAAEQRLSLPSSPMLNVLSEADYLAQSIVDVAMASKLLEDNTRAITYFQKSASVRVLPYARLALVGIPFTCLDEPRDFLSIPHEIGHYVFWHGRARPLPQGAVNTDINSYQEHLSYGLTGGALTSLNTLAHAGSLGFAGWSYVWLEELFADLFGFLMSGPAAALTAQEMAVSRSRSQLITSDNDHPVPVVRPYTHLKMLTASNFSNWSACVPLLKQNWQNLLPADIDKFYLPDGRAISIGEATVAGWTLDTSRPLDRLVSMIWNNLRPFGLAPQDWRKPITVPTTIAELVTQNESFIQSSAATAQASTVPTVTVGAGPVSFLDWAPKHLDLSAEMQSLLKHGSVTQPLSMVEWRCLVKGYGWTTEPGESNWPGH